MVSVGRCQQWYGCFQNMSTKRLLNTLFGVSSKLACSNHGTHLRCMSTNSDSKSANESDVKKLLDDCTVPEESSVVGDTENWTTSPYPKGLNYNIIKTIIVIYFNLPVICDQVHMYLTRTSLKHNMLYDQR